MRLSEKQRGVLGGAAAGLTVTLAGIGTALFLAPGGSMAHGGLYTRLNFWAGWSLPVILSLVLVIGLLARHRFLTPEDIDGGGIAPGTPEARVYQAVLQNTLEQAVLWLAVTLVWAIRMPGPTLAVIPLASILFVTGRALFLRGYAGGAPSRALGFALTFYPTVVMALLLTAEFAGVPFD